MLLCCGSGQRCDQLPQQGADRGAARSDQSAKMTVTNGRGTACQQPVACHGRGARIFVMDADDGGLASEAEMEHRPG